jgi:hypothetical protein
LKKLIEQGKKAISDGAEKLKSEIDSGMTTMQSMVNNLPIFMSVEKDLPVKQIYDEKHYFVIPYHLAESGFSLHTMRSLPDDAPLVNDLPKRRIFHFPNEYYESSLRVYMVNAAKNMSEDMGSQKPSSLESLANDIDALDSKLTFGMLLVGGIAAFFNPIVGAGIALKAVTPGVTGLLNKYGLKPMGKKMTHSQIEKQKEEAEEKVLQQFSDANTLKVINPILTELEYALRTNEDQHDPMLDPKLESADIPQLDNDNWRMLTERAVFHVYKKVIDDPTQYQQAKLGPEDIRWLKLMFVGHDT